MNKKTYKKIREWLANAPTNREWEALLAIQGVQKWKYSSYALHEIQAFAIIRGNNYFTEEELEND